MDTQHSQRDDSQSELYLIAHKVRGEPAFDIATRFKCPICEPIRQGLDEAERGTIHCDECDEGQHWWVIPTSGHRAYPYWAEPFSNFLKIEGSYIRMACLEPSLGWLTLDLNIPPDLPDHYATTAKPGQEKVTGLFEKLGFKKAAGPQVTRRI